jgi:hypothetical protein
MSLSIKRIIIAAPFLSLFFIGFSFISPLAAHSVTGASWKSGNIIDDGIFYNNTDMSAADIQNFLNGKVTCDTWGVKPSEWGGGTRAQYGASKGYPAPYTCLKDYTQDGKTAAQIIKEAADTYRISSKSLLVLLQKEQALVTDEWPWPIQYRSATGYGCPDTAPCDAEYYGFKNQVMKAAYQFRRYATYPNEYRYKPYQNNSIQFNPNTSCGSTNVYIENLATAGLYNYTPYQPNASALNNLYGTGDGCGAYGNRNFWRLFNDWFGSTNAPAFRASYDSQSPYPVIDSGVGISVFFQFKNTGTAFWKDDMSNFPGYRPIHLAATTPINRPSAFRASNWPASSRPTGIISKVFESDGVTLAAEQHTVQPGQIARFEFTIYVDPSIPPGVYREHFQPIIEGAPGYEWNIGGGVYLDIGVNRPALRAAFSGQSPYVTIQKGSSAAAYLAFKNVGNDPWFDDSATPVGKRPVRLASSWPINRSSDFGNTWPYKNRPGINFTRVYQSDGLTLSSAQHTVQPGQIAVFDFNFTVPSNQQSGVYKEYFEPILEGAPGYGWNMGTQAWLSVTVP